MARPFDGPGTMESSIARGETKPARPVVLAAHAGGALAATDGGNKTGARTKASTRGPELSIGRTPALHIGPEHPCCRPGDCQDCDDEAIRLAEYYDETDKWFGRQP